MSATEILASVDIVALRLDGNNQLQVLLIRREREPYAGQWALPGVIINGRCADTDLEAAATRALQDKARLTPAWLEQVATVGNGVRDPRGWSMSTSYLALVPPDTEVAGDDLQFAPLSQVLNRQQLLPFDHSQLITQAHERLSSKTVYTSLPLYLLPARFTVLDALGAFTACLGQALQNTSLRRRLERMKQEGWVHETGESNRPKLGRPQAILEHRPPPANRARTGSSELFIFDRSVLA